MATLIATDGSETAQTPTDGVCFTLAELCALTGARTIEMLTLRDGSALVVDEDGKGRGLPMNRTATTILGRFPRDMVVGPVLCLTRDEVRASRHDEGGEDNEGTANA